MKLIGLMRLGRDAELRYTTEGQPVASISGAWNYGRKGEDGRRPSQWCEFTLWGERAEKLQEWLTKGRHLFVVADDVHIETYAKRDGGGTGFKLVGKIESIEFAGGQEQAQGGQQGERQAQYPAGRTHGDRTGGPKNREGVGQFDGQAQGQQTPFDDMDSDIPF